MRPTLPHALRPLAALAAAAVLTSAAPAGAQIDPNDDGSGVKLGVEAVGGSGQVGDTTLFDSGAQTRLVVRIDGAHGHKELARVARGKTCDAYDLAQGYSLAPLKSDGVSRTLVQTTSSRLLSGNYVVVVLSTGVHGKPLACGHLYQ